MIIGTLPNNIQNGQSVDANPVMADFNFIVNQVNANGTPLGTLTAPSGTRAVFHQAAAPLGWTIDATITDHTIQMVASGGAINAGNPYSALFLNQFTIDSHTLSIAEMPSHAHTDLGHSHAITDPQHAHGGGNGAAFLNASGNQGQLTVGGATQFSQVSITATQATGISINTGNASLQNTGGGGGHTHTKTFNANYITCIVGVKT